MHRVMVYATPKRHVFRTLWHGLVLLIAALPAPSNPAPCPLPAMPRDSRIGQCPERVHCLFSCCWGRCQNCRKPSARAHKAFRGLLAKQKKSYAKVLTLCFSLSPQQGQSCILLKPSGFFNISVHRPIVPPAALLLNILEVGTGPVIHHRPACVDQ